MFNKIKRLSSTAKIHVFDYHNDILNPNRDLRSEIEQSFGPKGLGICLVSNVPDYAEKRIMLLIQGDKLGRQSKDELQKLTRPDLNYQVGWSCGVEKFQGQKDYAKGSYYGNPLINQTSQDNDLNIIPNVWPDECLPELQGRFMDLGQLISKVGIGLAGHLDHFVESNCQTYEKGKIKNILSNSQNVTGRLLHYFAQTESDTNDNWCGWHNDHSMLTGLTSAMYMEQSIRAMVIPPNQESQGLFAKNRQSDIQKIVIPDDCLAFQIGETIQIFSGGILEATPHCVKTGNMKNISRNAFAVFSSPKYNEKLDVPQGMDRENAQSKGSHQIPPLKDRWIPEQSFQDFHQRTILAYNT